MRFNPQADEFGVLGRDGHIYTYYRPDPQLHGNPGDAQRAAFCEGGYNVYEPQDFEPMQEEIVVMYDNAPVSDGVAVFAPGANRDESTPREAEGVATPTYEPAAE